jgi:hypothetical protein
VRRGAATVTALAAAADGWRQASSCLPGKRHNAAARFPCTAAWLCAPMRHVNERLYLERNWQLEGALHAASNAGADWRRHFPDSFPPGLLLLPVVPAPEPTSLAEPGLSHCSNASGPGPFDSRQQAAAPGRPAAVRGGLGWHCSCRLPRGRGRQRRGHGGQLPRQPGGGGLV